MGATLAARDQHRANRIRVSWQIGVCAHTFDGRIVLVNEMRLDELDGQTRLSYTSAADDYQLVFPEELRRHVRSAYDARWWMSDVVRWTGTEGEAHFGRHCGAAANGRSLVRDWKGWGWNVSRRSASRGAKCGGVGRTVHSRRLVEW